ncbi:MAG: asparaginase domain-containing protein [Dongiaceae bacterium]
MAADLLFLMMGGTIDEHYDGRIDTVKPNETSIIPRYVDLLNLYMSSRFVTVALKDSRELNQDDRRKLLQEIESAPETRIIITHGTYTMADSARYVAGNMMRRDARIVFTGSLMPLANFAESDAGFNLGFTVGIINSLPPGVYVCMNARVFSAQEVAKSKTDDRVFISIFDK